MKTDSLLINVGRGGLVDETALIAALDRGQPVHASLDVTEVEPLPEDSPLWGHPGITLTAHIAALTEHSARRSDGVFLDNLDRFLSGQDLRHLVHRDQVS